jgi:hypothetical protein
VSPRARPLALALRLLSLCALPLGACQPEPDPATAVVVSVMTDLIIGSELTHVTYRVFDRDAEPSFDDPVAEFSASADTLAQPFVIKKRNAEEFLLSVEGSAGPSAPPSIVYRAYARFEQGKTLALRVYLARVCAERPMCMFGGLTCYGEPRGDVRAGVCSTIPEATLTQVTRPGDESSWEPMRSASLDAGPAIVTGPRIPPISGWDAGSCSVTRPSASLPSATCSTSSAP